jgi:phage shock protein A
MSSRNGGFFARLGALIHGLLFGWVREREQDNPRAVYEHAIQKRIERYRELKNAVAGILYTRNKLEAELAERRGELARTLRDLERAVARNDDAAGLALIQHKQAVLEDVARAEREVETLRGEAEEAKVNLLRFREEIKALEREKGRTLATLANARARRRVHEALDGMSVDADVQALEAVRGHVARMVAASSLERELSGGDETAQRIRALRQEANTEGARRELEELKRAHGTRRIPALAGGELAIVRGGSA